MKRAPVRTKTKGPAGIPTLVAAKRKKWLLAASAAVVIAIYAVGLRVPLYLDDAGIVTEDLIIKDLSLKTLSRIAFHSVTRNRPVANLSLAVNYTLAPNPDRPWSFHATNTAIHLACFFAVFLFLKKLLELPSIPLRYRERSFSLSWAAAFLWAVHPIQTQAVTYVIQRMTSMAALFYFLALYFYLRGREGKRRFFFYSGAAFLLGLGSKEIVATLPAAIFLIEWLFYRTKKSRLFGIILVSGLLIFASGFVFTSNNLLKDLASILQNTFSNRNFSVTDRLMTQPRVFLLYISLTLFPWYSRYVLDYDFLPSRSLLLPSSTLFSWIFLMTTIAAGFGLRKKNAVLTFCIFSFWLGHAIEGSIFNLELVFEHRMYLPSVFLILGLVLSTGDLLARLKAGKKWGTIILASVAAFLAVQTHLRNAMWSNPVAFYRNNIRHTPRFFRPYHNLGTYYFSEKNYEMAIASYTQAISLKPESGLSYFGIGQAYYAKKDYEQAAAFYEKSMVHREWNIMLSLNLIDSYLRLNRYEDGLRTAFSALQKFPEDSSLMMMTGIIGFYAVQNRGDEGRALLSKYGWSESSALAFLEKAHALGLRDQTLYQNLTLAYLKSAEGGGDRRNDLLGRGEAIAREGLDKFPADNRLRAILAEIVAARGR